MISQLFEILQVIILILVFTFFVVAVEYKKLAFAIISFAIANGFLSLLFFALGAPFVGVFNFSVFSGAFAILFLATINLESPKEESDVFSNDEEGEL